MTQKEYQKGEEFDNAEIFSKKDAVEHFAMSDFCSAISYDASERNGSSVDAEKAVMVRRFSDDPGSYDHYHVRADGRVEFDRDSYGGVI